MASQVQDIIIRFTADTGELKEVKTSVEQLGKAIEGEVVENLKEAGIELNKLGKSEGFKSLRSQIKDAKSEAQALAQQFGENSKQALNAQKNVARLTEELDDFNQRVKALNPEAKFNAVSNALQGTLGALQGVTGALQLFGAESEDVTKIAQKLQGALNLAQGINSVIGLKDAFANLRIVLGLTATAQTTLAGATSATAVATEGAAVATTAFGAALTATGIGAIVVALGGLIAALIALERQADAAAASLQKLDQDAANRLNASQIFADKFNETLRLRLDLLDFEVQKAQARGAAEKEVLGLQIKRTQAEITALNAATATGRLLEEDQKKFTERTREAIQQLELLEIKLRSIRDPQANIEEIKLLPNPKQLEVQAQDALDVLKAEFKDVDWELPPFFTEEELKRQAEIVRGVLAETTSLAVDLITQSNQQAYDEDLKNLQDQKEKKAITEEAYQKRLRQLKRREAEDQKKAALFQASLDFAGALVNALTFKPAAGIPAALILANVVAAANIARIAAAPIPKFKTGTLNVGGGNLDGDGGMLAMVHKGEAIIPKDRNADYFPSVRAIFNRTIKPKDLNDFVMNRINGGREPITAQVDSGSLARALKKNKGVEVTNAGTLGKVIAREIANTYNHRRV